MTQPALNNRRIVLASRPGAVATTDCFRLENAPVPAIREGELLLRTLWLSLDPYMRGRMSDAPSYAAPVGVGEVMTGGVVAEVAESRHAKFAAGDLVVAGSGWQDYAVSDGTAIMKLPADLAKPSFALGVLGMPGFTAYMGLTDIGKPQPGETVVVAAATGAVGSVVGQVAKIKGCRAVGIAGGRTKCDWAVQELGFDACLDHHEPGLRERLAAACPQGIDVYFENVGGPVFEAVLPLLNPRARIALCGLIAQYNAGAGGAAGAQAGGPPGAPGAAAELTTAKLMRTLLVRRITLRGFIIFDDYGPRHGEFLAAMTPWVRSGQIKYREDVVHGLENAPHAFLGLLEGRNFGKLVVEVAERRAPTA